jgi:hypothetical protein
MGDTFVPPLFLCEENVRVLRQFWPSRKYNRLVRSYKKLVY